MDLSNQPMGATLRPAGGLKPPRPPFKSASGLPDEWYIHTHTHLYTYTYYNIYTPQATQIPHPPHPTPCPPPQHGGGGGGWGIWVAWGVYML